MAALSSAYERNGTESSQSLILRMLLPAYEMAASGLELQGPDCTNGITRHVLAERVLQLPPDIRIDQHQPSNHSLRNLEDAAR